jgi:glycosyltransferase involved in cell wall biosynthesis
VTRRVFQLVPFLDPGDAIGNHARYLARILGGVHAGFIVEQAAPGFADATPYARAKVAPDDVLVYHLAHASRLGRWMARVDAIKVIDYHNITPPEFFRAYEPHLAVALEGAFAELESLRDQVRLAVAHSEFSRRELEEMGYAHTAALPLLLDLAWLDGGSGLGLTQVLDEGTTGRGDLLFVGRVAPNKRIEDVVKAFTVFRRTWSPQARLWLVGRCDSPSYLAALRAFVARLGIEEVHLLGQVPAEALAAYYRSAGVFVSMSEHEGFGAPLIEAMHAGLPVVAYAAGAVPETVAGGGIVFRAKRYDEVAALIAEVTSDDGVRAALVAAGRARADHFRPQHHEDRYRALIGAL